MQPAPMQPPPPSRPPTKKISFNADDLPAIAALIRGCCRHLVNEGLLLEESSPGNSTITFTLMSVARVIRPTLTAASLALQQTDGAGNPSSSTGATAPRDVDVFRRASRSLPHVPHWKLKLIWNEMNSKSA
jgi:hypothetical protein